MIPEIGKFETKLLDYYTELKRFEHMIVKFDELLTYKANRKHVDDVYKSVERQFVQIDD